MGKIITNHTHFKNNCVMNNVQNFYFSQLISMYTFSFNEPFSMVKCTKCFEDYGAINKLDKYIIGI